MSNGELRVRLARSFEDIARVISVRSRVYMQEQHCPYDEEFDGNDLAGATHLLAEWDGEPVGSMRIRWFADFAKVERLAVVSGRRGGIVAKAIIDFAADFMARKNYRCALGHIEEDLVPFWTRIGQAKIRDNRQHFAFSDRRYLEVVRELDPPANAISIDSPPLMVLRPEGDWDRPGVLDQSTKRTGSASARV